MNIPNKCLNINVLTVRLPHCPVQLVFRNTDSCMHNLWQSIKKAELPSAFLQLMVLRLSYLHFFQEKICFGNFFNIP